MALFYSAGPNRILWILFSCADDKTKEEHKMALQHLKTAEFDGTAGQAPLAMVDFWAPWCGPCQMLGPVMEDLAVRYEGKALVAKVNVDEEPELARRYGVMNIPTVIFLKEGREFDRKIGAFPSAVYTEVLDRAL
jgi:thioredoxin 1